MKRWRYRLAVLAVFLAAALALPFVKTDRFSGSIRQALERTLHRRVSVGNIHFHLVPAPGFSVDDVVIQDDPAIGLEPFAYVTSLDVRVHWFSLFSRRLEIERLRLQEPSVNLTKTSAGEWNFQHILRETLSAGPRGTFPSLEVRSGRINFKFGTLKSAFYLTNADLDLAPAAGFSDRFRLRFTGEPARTDRAAQGFGTLTASGWWRSPGNGESELDMDLAMERSGIADIMTLIAGRDIGVHGSMTSRARVSGRISALDIQGELRLQDLHRWDMLPNRTASWPVSYRGRLDLWNQRLELETVHQGEPKLPFVVRVRASEYLAEPRWAVSASVEEMPVAYLVEMARQLGTTFLEGLTLQGRMNGVIGYASQSGAQGQMVLKDASVEMPGSGPLRLAEARVTVDGGAYHLDRADVALDGGDTISVEGDYNRQTEALRFSLSTDGVSHASTHAAMLVLPGSIAPPLLSECQGGLWRGSLKYARAGQETGAWAGGFTVEKTQWSIPGVADPVRVASASVALQPAAVALTKLKGKVGDIQFTGEWRRTGEKSSRLQLTIPEADAEELERVLGPSLQRRQTFLARALRRVAPIPEWLRTRAVLGNVRIGLLHIGGEDLQDVRANLQWRSTEVEFTGLEARMLEARARGSLLVNLRAAEPIYTLEGRLTQLPWRGGQLELDAKVETTGIGQNLWLNLTAGGTMTAKALQVGGEDVKSLVGSYEFSAARGVPRLHITGMELTVGDETYYGQGGTLPDGRLQFELASGKQKMRLAGSLTPLQVEIQH
jgi:AsmA protein